MNVCITLPYVHGTLPFLETSVPISSSVSELCRRIVCKSKNNKTIVNNTSEPLLRHFYWPLSLGLDKPVFHHHQCKNNTIYKGRQWLLLLHSSYTKLSTLIRRTITVFANKSDVVVYMLNGVVNDKLTRLTSLFILQPEDHRPMWYIHTITGEHRY